MSKVSFRATYQQISGVTPVTTPTSTTTTAATYRILRTTYYFLVTIYNVGKLLELTQNRWDEYPNVRVTHVIWCITTSEDIVLTWRLSMAWGVCLKFQRYQLKSSKKIAISAPSNFCNHLLCVWLPTDLPRTSEGRSQKKQPVHSVSSHGGDSPCENHSGAGPFSMCYKVRCLRTHFFGCFFSLLSVFLFALIFVSSFALTILVLFLFSFFLFSLFRSSMFLFLYFFLSRSFTRSLFKSLFSFKICVKLKCSRRFWPPSWRDPFVMSPKKTTISLETRVSGRKTFINHVRAF